MFNPWLNLHRPCMFATETVSPKVKVVKRYRTQDVKTPLACLAQLAQKDLVKFKAGVTLAELLAQAQAQTDLVAAKAMQEAKAKLFAMFNKPKVKLRA